MLQALALVLATSFAAPAPQLTAAVQLGSHRHLCRDPEASCPHRLGTLSGSSTSIKKVRTITIHVPKAS